MKKTVLAVFTAFLLLLTLVACNTDDSHENNGSTIDSSAVENTTESNITTEAVVSSASDTVTEGTEAIEENESVTLDGIVELFANDYSSQRYNAEMIAYIRNNLTNMGVILNGEITAIVHLTKKASSPELSDWSWAYVYQFADEADAVAFEESRRALSNSSAESEVCVRLGLIVVFGTATTISSISK